MATKNRFNIEPGERWRLPSGHAFVVEYVTGSGTVFGVADNRDDVSVGAIWLQEHGQRVAR